MFQVKIEVKECTKCKRTETARWYYKTTPSPICCSCYRKSYVKANREKALASAHRANKSEKSKKARKDYGTSDKWKARRRELEKERYWNDPEAGRAKRVKYKKPGYLKEYYVSNKAAYHERSTRRRRQLDKASLGGILRSETVDVYANCPEGHEVDHIIPIRGYDFLDGVRQHVVCGLHIPKNLQYLTKADNRKKSCNLYSVEDKSLIGG